MAVKVCTNDADFSSAFSSAGPRLVVMYFTASWCGPCRMISPHVDTLSRTHARKALFIKIDVDQCKQTARDFGIKAMPTFLFFHNNTQLPDTVQGANPDALRTTVEKLVAMPGVQPNVFTGSGRALGGGGGPSTPAVSGGSGSSSSHHGQNPLFVEQLMNMGFPENRAVKGLIKTGGNNVQSAMDWIFAHMDDNDIDDEVTPDPMDVSQSQQKKELTPEERERQRQLIQHRIDENRQKREEDEKKREKEREIARMVEGKNATEAKRKWAEEKKLRDAYELKREREADKRYKAKVLEQIRKDKLERQARRGNEDAQSQLEAAARKKEMEKAAAQATAPSSAAVKSYDSCTLQIRLPDGSTLRESFSPSDTMGDVVDRINASGRIHTDKVMTNFPKKIFSGSDLLQTLKDTDLCPRGQVIVPKA